MLQHPEAADVLNKLLFNEATRPLAATVASRLGPKAKGSASALAEALTDDRPGVRQDVAIALASLGPDAKPALETLIQTLRRESNMIAALDPFPRPVTMGGWVKPVLVAIRIVGHVTWSRCFDERSSGTKDTCPLSRLPAAVGGSSAGGG